MKIALAFLVLATSASALASWGPDPVGVPAWDHDRTSPNPIDRYPDRDIPGHAPYSGGGIPIASCSPEMVQGNVAATDRTLTTLATSPSFSSASQFRAQVSRIASMKNPNEKVANYFALIGIDSAKKSDIADFVGARSIDARWLTSLQQNSGLSNVQADTVATEMQTALRGTLQ